MSNLEFSERALARLTEEPRLATERRDTELAITLWHEKASELGSPPPVEAFDLSQAMDWSDLSRCSRHYRRHRGNRGGYAHRCHRAGERDAKRKVTSCRSGTLARQQMRLPSATGSSRRLRQACCRASIDHPALRNT